MCALLRRRVVVGKDGQRSVCCARWAGDTVSRARDYRTWDALPWWQYAGDVVGVLALLVLGWLVVVVA